MSNQHLEQEIAALSARVTHQNSQIADLEKQLTDMQAAMSCDLEEVIKLSGIEISRNNDFQKKVSNIIHN